MTKSEILSVAKPIIFSGLMVNSTLTGRKTMTRKVIKPQPERKPRRCGFTPGGWAIESEPAKYGAVGCQCGHKCTPPYDVTNLLYVRETWQYIKGASGSGYAYHAGGGAYNDAGEWRSPVSMPRKAARLFLHVTDVRAERLQDISESDAKAEGVYTHTPTSFNNTYIFSFREKWNADYAKRGYSWDSNPWVWVITFERVIPSDESEAGQ
jgi:hypothetical protein